MSTPPGSRGSRGSHRARESTRGSARGGSREKPAQSGRSTGSTKASRENDSNNHSKPPRNSTEKKNGAWNRNGSSPQRDGAQVSSAILSHAGTISKLKDQPWRNAAEQNNVSYKQRMSDLYQKLKERRERERKQAIKDGFLADPEKPRSLANAITPVGTCQDMCPEFERVERIVQFMVDASEKIPSTSDPGTKVPSEELMVKRFRRSAAGYDEQLPSDIRPPRVLQKTLNYLFESIIGGPEPLATTHKFVWDRTRGIRNDFSIQQVSKIEDLKIAIDCFERIARFHILSLHQLSHPTKDNGGFDHHQEREQLNNTLLSLMYYYEDSRRQLVSPNEAEFRAYCIIFEIQDQRPDLEDRAQNWPSSILQDSRVKTALRLYAAAGNSSDEQGPLRPRTTFSIAQANTRGFFDMVESQSVSYIMACVAEIYFNLVRSTALEAIWTAYKRKRPGSTIVEDWGMEDVTLALGLDDHDQARTFCEEHGFEIGQREDGEEFLDLGAVVGRSLEDHNPRRKQIFSKHIVEAKRLGRSFPSVIDGLSFLDAQARGLVNASDTDALSPAQDDSLFINDDSDGDQQRSRSASPFSNTTKKINVNGVTSPFNTTNNENPPPSKPNPFNATTSPQSRPLSAFPSKPGPTTTSQANDLFAPKNKPDFDFFAPANQKQPPPIPKPSPFGSTPAPKIDFSNPSGQKETSSPFKSSSLGSSGAPKFDFYATSNQTEASKTPASSPFASITTTKLDSSAASSLEEVSTAPAPSSSNSTGTPKFDFAAALSKQQATTVPTQSASGSGGAFKYPRFDFSLGANANKQDDKATGVNLTNGEAKHSGSAPFGAALVKPNAEATSSSTSVFGTRENNSTQPAVFGSPASFSPKAPIPEPSSQPDKNKVTPPFGESKSTTKRSDDTPKLSFGTSPLFQSVTKESKDNSQSVLLESASNFSHPAITLQAPDSANAAQDTTKAGSSQSLNFTSTPPTTTISPASNFAVPDTPAPFAPSQEKGTVKASDGRPPSTTSFFLPSNFSDTQIQQPTTTSAFTSTSSGTKFPSSSSNLTHTKAWAPSTQSADPRPAILEKVTDGLMFDEGGLFQQYIEISIAPMINSAIAQFEDEESWKIARKYRFVFLSKKFFGKWKTQAWNLGVMRRGRQRRQNFARSIQSLAKSTKDRAQEMGRSSIFGVNKNEKPKQEPMAHGRDIPSPSEPSRKRHSLPVGSRVEMSGAIQAPRSSKRKLDDSEALEGERTFSPHVPAHKRSNTVGSSINANLNTSAPSPLKSNKKSNAANGSRLINNESIMTQARRIAPNMYSDTTRTDYFRLKALGINPDTPIAPLTKSRVVASEKETPSLQTPKRSIGVDENESPISKRRRSNEPKKPDISTAKDDDEFFASIRAIRSTLADSTAWFQTERQNIELSLTPSQASMSPPSGKKETAAERRLREFREKSHTPSRSEVRIRAMGDKSLLPANFWDGERQEGSAKGGSRGKRKSSDLESEDLTGREKKRRESLSQNSAIGFAALANGQSSKSGGMGFAGFASGRPHTGTANGFHQHDHARAESFQQVNGDNIDVIELSD